MPIHVYHITEIAKITNGRFLQQASDDAIRNLSLDSRKLTEPEHTLFFAVKGKRHDGHLFLADLHSRGVRNFIVSENVDVSHLTDSNILLVKDSIRALQALTAYHRGRFKIPVIGITGSNGKTIVKEWLNQLLDEDYHIVRSPKSYNSQVGVPLSVWRMHENHTLAIFEAGISEPGEMEYLEKVIRPTIGIFTNIGDAHSEGFLNNRHKAKEKLRLFINSDIIIFCKDYHEITQGITEIKQQLSDDEIAEGRFRLFTWSKTSDADLRIAKIEKGQTETYITGDFHGEPLSITAPFTDDASIENVITCWATLLYMGIDPKTITDRIAGLAKVAMRLELKDAINGCSLINDSYNSDLGSLTIALDFLDQQQQQQKKTVILSDILQSGKNERDLYLSVAELIEKKQVNRLIGIGPAITREQAEFKQIKGLETAFFASTDEFVSQMNLLNFGNEIILLKGARAFEFEKISKLLEQQVHETVLEINLNALAENLQAYTSLLRPGVKTMIMVKAFSYGSGGFEIANALQFHRADYLAVAYADEGVALRKGGITLPIMVMNPEVRSFDSIIHYGLEPDLYSPDILQKFLRALAANKKAAMTLPFPVHIEIDTGMYRLGFSKEELPALLEVLKDNKLIQIKSIFSHLAGSEDKVHDGYTEHQIALYRQLSQQIMEGLDYQPLRHILNSAGIVRFSDAQFDMVRLGVGLYGIDTTEHIQGKLKPISTLKTTISQIKQVYKGETIGYGRRGVADTDLRIATIGIGYADGIDRRLGNGVGQMLIHGQLAPLIGSVCMDMCMLNITHIPDAQVGDEVIAFGQGLPVQQVADWAGTIPYEILTGISTRVKRIYFQE